FSHVSTVMNVFVLLLTKPDLTYTDQKPAVPLISPDRLQFFEYESVSVSCEEDKEVKAWRVRRKLHKTSSANDSDACSVPAASCSIQYAFESHSGEYWCENHEGEKSRALNISVTAGSVILDVSAQPVKEGSTVTLKCIQEDTEEPNFETNYKNHRH
uniref:Ig-like domain-containing protein n=1 Tax=Poecilia formosa TaxID=48698 RepID=A0A096LZF2_POEFO